MKTVRAFFASMDRRDAVGAAGLVMLVYGGEALHAGVGFAVAGAILVAIAVLR